MSFLAARFPVVADKLVASFRPLECGQTPWTEVSRPLAESKFAIVTTAGVHHQDQQPFDMTDPNGEPGNIYQQAALLGKALEVLGTNKTPGVIVDLNWQWRRQTCPPAPWLSYPPNR